MSKAQDPLFDKYQTDYMSGYLAFDSRYVSEFQLLKSIEELVNADPNWVSVVLRNSGENHAIDFMYKNEALQRGDRLNTFKKWFEEKLGGDYLVRWSFADPAYRVK